MGDWNDFNDSIEPGDPDFLAAREPSTGKRQLQIHCATHEELLAKGYVLSLNELNLPPSPELDEIINQCPTNQAQFCGNSVVVSSCQ
ncbi:hypothetical protein ACEUDN_21675 [Aeromonas hydrophila]|uniref:hypothetical protein n=1 Tax=Aeromonas hydrophila TaxID=644 RepID=UPI0038D01C1C